MTAAIRRALFSPGVSAFFFDDQRAIKAGARRDGFVYRGAPLTPGFRAIRQAGQSVSVLLVLDDGQVAAGDCAAVQYSGAGGRDPLFLADAVLPVLEREVRPRLEGRPLAPFREMAGWIDDLRVDGRPLHTALRYGLSQALLAARAAADCRLPCETVCAEYSLPLVPGPVPVFGQSGDARRENADKMILKQADVLPHGLVNAVDGKLGRDGSGLRAYLRWLARRVRRLRLSPDYRPVFHVDTYGTIGLIFDQDPARVAEFVASLEADAAGFPLYIEGPVDLGAKDRQMAGLRAIRERLHALGSPVRIVADEWCNTREDVIDFCAAGAGHMVQVKTPDLGGLQHTIESVLHCRAHGMEAYQGGTCNETEVSARLCVHAACAARPDRLLAKPGMGFDEGFTIVHNEMQRIVRLLRWRLEEGGSGAETQA